MPIWSGGTLQLGAGIVTNNEVSSSAAIDADKMQHVYYAGTNFALAIGGTPTDREELVFLAGVAGTFRQFYCVLTDSGTSTAITFDLKKNGVSVLSSAVSYVHGDGDGTVKTGTLSTTTFSAGDRISIFMDVTSATGAQGPFAVAVLEENSPP